MSNEFIEKIQLRTRELKAMGLEFTHAFGRAHFEYLLNHEWPTSWGNEYQVLLYGDFRPPAEELSFPALGVRILHEPLENTFISTAMTVVAARVAISERSIDQIVDAHRRINILLGSWTLVTWGNSSVSWWSHLFGGSGSGLLEPFDQPDLDRALAGAISLPIEARQRLESAMYWVREPGRTVRESQRSNLLRKYSALWNAFECLVDAVNILSPVESKLSKAEKTAAIARYLEARHGAITPEDIQYCYQHIVNPGLVGKSRHALNVCFGHKASRYAEECFTRHPAGDRLYNIRNAINHGEIDAENPDELLRVEARFGSLFFIVWGMFGRLVPFPCPVDPDLAQTTDQ